jgi:hypothetical protein
MKVEVSRPHYHPGKDFKTPVTKKRDLSVPPHWVANERITHPGTGHSYAIVMPPRDFELYETHQEVHIHIPLYTKIEINGKEYMAKVKVHEGYGFKPVVHFDHIEAEKEGIKGGEDAVL